MSASCRKIPALLALACALLAENSLPLAGGVWLSDSAAASGAANNGTWSGRNPTEYTIGGVLSGAEGIERHFTQILGVSSTSGDKQNVLRLCMVKIQL